MKTHLKEYFINAQDKNLPKHCKRKSMLNFEVRNLNSMFPKTTNPMKQMLHLMGI